MRNANESPEVHLNWNVILVLITLLLLSTGMWGAAIGALMVLWR